jgi:benzoyl-CoA-dihydrodiol lyase
MDQVLAALKDYWLRNLARYAARWPVRRDQPLADRPWWIHACFAGTFYELALACDRISHAGSARSASSPVSPDSAVTVTDLRGHFGRFPAVNG